MKNKTISIKFAFKGSREYIQGPDMLNQSILSLVSLGIDSNIETLKFNIHKMTDKNLIAHLTQGANHSTTNEIATFSFKHHENIYTLKLLESEQIPSERVAYDEAQVTSHSHIDVEKKSISIMSSPFSFIETVVSMNKHLHLTLLPDTIGKWVFCRWESPLSIAKLDAQNLKVILKQTLGTKLTSSEVFQNEVLIGKVYFSAKVS